MLPAGVERACRGIARPSAAALEECSLTTTSGRRGCCSIPGTTSVRPVSSVLLHAQKEEFSVLCRANRLTTVALEFPGERTADATSPAEKNTCRKQSACVFHVAILKSDCIGCETTWRMNVSAYLHDTFDRQLAVCWNLLEEMKWRRMRRQAMPRRDHECMIQVCGCGRAGGVCVEHVLQSDGRAPA